MKGCVHSWVDGVPKGMVFADTGGARVCEKCGLVEGSEGWHLWGVNDTLTVHFRLTFGDRITEARS